MSNIIKRLEEDARKTGFPSELRAARVLSSRGWTINGNSYFLDPVDKKAREIDIQAHKSKHLVIDKKSGEEVKDDQEGGLFGHPNHDLPIGVWSFLSVEVKKSDKPWVVFASERGHSSDWGINLLCHKQNTQGLLPFNMPVESHPSIRGEDFFGRTGYIAFSQPKQDDSTFFGAVVVAVKAALATHLLASDHGEAWSETSTDLAFYTPAVVVDAPLFRAVLDGEKLVFSERGWIPYRLNFLLDDTTDRRTYGRNTFIVDIVALERLDDYLRAHEEWIKGMYEEVRKNRLGGTKAARFWKDPRAVSEGA